MWTPWTRRSGAPALSVVMPSFNQGEFIARSVRSVLAPDALPPPDIELVVMDGGSSDGTLDQLAALAVEFAGRLRWFSGPDGGPAQAINRAVREARAPLIGWLNSDDLYTPGAVARALAHLQAHPQQVMVYGEARHVDLNGADLGAYPTLGPDTPLAAWADGCPICQPSVFFRRQAFIDLGGLDETLQAAFDYELWLRFFKAHPGGIGFIPVVQAESRLHEGGITLKFRERVAREGIRVVHQHLGPAPLHWLLTYLSDLCQRHPFHATPLDLPGHLRALVAELQDQLQPGAAGQLADALADDRRLACATVQQGVGVDHAGRAGAQLWVRLQQPPAEAPRGFRPVGGLRLLARHSRPGPLRLHLHGPDGQPRSVEVDGPGLFEIFLPVHDLRPAVRCQFRIDCAADCLPPDGEPAFWVEACDPLTPQRANALSLLQV